NGNHGWVACDYQGNPSLVVLGDGGTLDAWTGSRWQRIGVAATQLYSGFSDLIGQQGYLAGANFVVRNGNSLLAWDGSQFVAAPSSIASWAVGDYQGRATVA